METAIVRTHALHMAIQGFRDTCTQWSPAADSAVLKEAGSPSKTSIVAPMQVVATARTN